MSKKIPLLPLRDVVIFPHMVVPLFVGREKSIAALEKAVEKHNNQLFLVTQKDASVLNPVAEDLNEIGTLVNVVQMLRLPDNTVKVLIEGRQRARLQEFSDEGQVLCGEVEPLSDEETDSVALQAVVRSVKSSFEQYSKLNKRIPPELMMSISAITEPDRLADVIVAHLGLKVRDKQTILETVNLKSRLEIILEKMQGEIEIINVEKKIRSRVKNQMERSQKEYYLNEQMNAIRKELGSKDDGKNEIQEMEERLAQKNMPLEAVEKVRKEIKKLKSMSPMSAESGVVRNYIDWMLSLPWAQYTQDRNDVKVAREILDDEHYGLEDVKERMIEYLAVKSLLSEEGKGTILCLAGPPGVGKTSIAKSLAHALERKFVRISLGGVRDEAEIRGHRRTYVGAMPGKIIQALKKSGTGNPVVLLDEIDKMSNDFRGDPAAAMLEVLDPEQNKNFGDHYLEVEYDLSQVMFVMTANDISKIPGPLRDRMEIINLSGYTPLEKTQIAKRYLLKKAKENNGIDEYSLTLSDKMLTKLICRYTKEAGVRDLQRKVNTVARKIATEIVENDYPTSKKFQVSEKQLEKYLGPMLYEEKEVEETPQVGLTNGLAWTSVGGEILNIEVITMPGTGKIQVTGKLGDVMKESAQTALSYVRSMSDRLGVDAQWYAKNDIHIHIPEGAIPKDGPSAGITLATAITSAVTGIPVSQEVAMTGEITLRGRVLPIGGLKEKLLAAKQAGVTTVLIPQKNAKDLIKVSKEISDGLTIVPCYHVEEVFKMALELKRPEEFMKVVGLKVLQAEEEKDLPKVANQ